MARIHSLVVAFICLLHSTGVCAKSYSYVLNNEFLNSLDDSAWMNFPRKLPNTITITLGRTLQHKTVLINDFTIKRISIKKAEIIPQPPDMVKLRIEVDDILACSGWHVPAGWFSMTGTGCAKNRNGTMLTAEVEFNRIEDQNGNIKVNMTSCHLHVPVLLQDITGMITRLPLVSNILAQDFTEALSGFMSKRAKKNWDQAWETRKLPLIDEPFSVKKFDIAKDGVHLQYTIGNDENNDMKNEAGQQAKKLDKGQSSRNRA